MRRGGFWRPAQENLSTVLVKGLGMEVSAREVLVFSGLERNAVSRGHVAQRSSWQVFVDWPRAQNPCLTAAGIEKGYRNSPRNLGMRFNGKNFQLTMREFLSGSYSKPVPAFDIVECGNQLGPGAAKTTQLDAIELAGERLKIQLRAVRIGFTGRRGDEAAGVWIEVNDGRRKQLE